MKLTLTRNELGIVNAAVQFSEMGHQCQQCGHTQAKTRWLHGPELAFAANIAKQIKKIAGEGQTIPEGNHELSVASVGNDGHKRLAKWIEDMSWAANDMDALLGVTYKLLGCSDQ